MRTHRARGLLLMLAVLLITLPACGDGDDDDNQAGSTTTEGSTTTTDGTTSSTSSGGSTTTPTSQDQTQTVVRSYFLRDEKVGPVAREATGSAVATDALEGLLTGPSANETELGFSSAVPGGTKLLGVTITDRIATVDLSKEFGSGGGSASMMGRVAQVVFTATQFPTVDAVTFEMEGKPLTELGGEGLILDEPQTRADWEDLSPAILVESPLPFADASSPLRIQGTANTFEAAFLVNVTDGDGLIVYDEPAMATSGSGTRGTFDISATFTNARPGVGAVIVFEESAKDGSQINIVEVPIRLS